MMVSLAKPHYTNQGIKFSRALPISIVDEALLPKADYTGCVSGNKQDKSEVFEYQISMEVFGLWVTAACWRNSYTCPHLMRSCSISPTAGGASVWTARQSRQSGPRCRAESRRSVSPDPIGRASCLTHCGG